MIARWASVHLQHSIDKRWVHHRQVASLSHGNTETLLSNGSRVYGLQEETWVPEENPDIQKKNMQTSFRKITGNLCCKETMQPISSQSSP